MHPVMTVLASGVPLTLLLDLLPPAGPDSAVIYLLEKPRGRAEVASIAGVRTGAGA
jgi:hypothetical protein